MTYKCALDFRIIEILGKILQCCSEHQSCDIITQRNCIYIYILLILNSNLMVDFTNDLMRDFTNGGFFDDNKSS
jgi:hypothetical protein